MAEYKDRELLKFKGLTWRYSKYYGHWTPVEEENLLGHELPTVFSGSGSNEWTAQFSKGATPKEALENWLSECIRFDEREAASFREQLYELGQALVKLHAKSWKVSGTKKKAKKASKKKAKGSNMAKATPAVDVTKDGKLVKSDTAKMKKPKKAKIQERVWAATPQGRFTRMKRKERFIHSVKSVVDMMAQKGLVFLPENLLIDLYDNNLITQREFKRLVSVTGAKVGTVTQKQSDGKRRVVAKAVR